MKKLLLSLLALLTLSAPSLLADSWVETPITDLATGDVIVIVDKTSACAMTNNNGANKAPSAVSVTLSDDKEAITSTVPDNLKFTITVGDGGLYKFGAESNFLYCNASNDGVRIGTSADNIFTWDADNNKLKNKAKSRWIGVYTTNKEWRCYTKSDGNIANTVTAFYKLISDSKAGNELSWSAESYEYTIGETLDAPTLSNPNNLAVTYSSENETVATIDANGSLTIVGGGSTTITASTEGDETHKSGEVNYVLTVTDPNTIKDIIDANFDGFTNKYQEYTVISNNGITYKLYAYKNGGLQFNHKNNTQAGLVVTNNENGYILKSIKFNCITGGKKLLYTETKMPILGQPI